MSFSVPGWNIFFLFHRCGIYWWASEVLLCVFMVTFLSATVLLLMLLTSEANGIYLAVALGQNKRQSSPRCESQRWTAGCVPYNVTWRSVPLPYVSCWARLKGYYTELSLLRLYSLIHTFIYVRHRPGMRGPICSANILPSEAVRTRGVRVAGWGCNVGMHEICYCGDLNL